MALTRPSSGAALGAWLLAVAAACTTGSLDLVGRPCPCAPEYVCDLSTMRCVAAGGVDGGDSVAVLGFGVRVEQQAMRVRVGTTTNVRVTIERAPWFRDPVTVSIADVPSGVSAASQVVGPEVSGSLLPIVASDSATTGTSQLSVVAVSNGTASRTTLQVEIAGRLGSLDLSFGEQGYVRGPTARHEMIAGPNGSFLAVVLGNPSKVARFDKDGKPDQAFGSGGATAIALPPSASGYLFAAHPAGGIVVGLASSLQRMNIDGSPDPSFGTGGTAVVTRPSAVVEGILHVRPLADGAVVLMARETASTGRVFVTRLTNAGAIDASFGSSGFTNVSSLVWYLAKGAVGYEDGRLLYAGAASSIAGGDTFFARYSASGAPDVAIGANGVMKPGGQNFEWMGAQRTGRVLTKNMDELRGRTADLAPDPTFGSAGAFTKASELRFQSNPTLLSDDRIAFLLSPVGLQGGILRVLRPDGTDDPDFGSQGVPAPLGTSGVATLLEQPPGRLLVASDVGISRLWL